MSDIIQELCGLLPKRISQKTDELMKNHTTMRVGGPAALFVSPSCQEELSAVLRACEELSAPYEILGHGSNLLVSDKGYEGVVIALEGGLAGCEADAGRGYLTAGAGVSLARAARTAMEASLSGLEFAAGIPGTVGGAVVMNAGAYGSEMKDVLAYVRVMSPDGNVYLLNVEELELGYRASCIRKRRFVVLEAVFKLTPGDRSQILGRMEELAAKRRHRQPLEFPSAGSTFKRPAGYYAGKLIQDAGLAGYRVGDAQVSEKHCGFVINRGHATAAQVMQVCRDVERQVEERFGVRLEMEVRRWGRFDTTGEGDKCGIGDCNRDVRGR